MRAGLRSGWPYVVVVVGLLAAGPAFSAGQESSSVPEGAAGEWTVAPAYRAGTPSTVVHFQNRYYAAFRSDDPAHRLVIASSADGIHFDRKARTYPLRVGSDPALAVFHNQLYVAFRSDDGRNRLVLTSSRDGANFLQPARVFDELRLGSAPSLAVFDNQLFVGFQSQDARRALVLASSFDGVDFFCPTTRIYPGYRPNNCVGRVHDEFQLGGQPVLSARGDRLYVRFPAEGPERAVYETSSANGINFTRPARVSEPGPVSRRPSADDRAPGAAPAAG